ISGDITIFQYSDSINSYLQQDSISQLIAACRRTYEYDSRNKIGKQNFDMAINYLASQKMNVATTVFQSV
ncbi:MAG: hypothetical protein ABIT08_00810, partial [Bacteroidia bacterium]